MQNRSVAEMAVDKADAENTAPPRRRERKSTGGALSELTDAYRVPERKTFGSLRPRSSGALASLGRATRATRSPVGEEETASE